VYVPFYRGLLTIVSNILGYGGSAVRVLLVIDRHGRSPCSLCEQEKHQRAFVGAKLLDFPLRCPENGDFGTASFDARPRIF